MRLLPLLLALFLAGCGAVEDVKDTAREQVAQVKETAADIRQEADKLGAKADELREELEKRVRETLDQIEQAVPAAQTDAEAPRRASGTMEQFLTEVIGRVDAYWEETLAAADLPRPRVSYVWIPPGQATSTACGTDAGDDAAFYCPADDTIYISQALAQQVLEGIREGLPGQAAGEGRAIGDFGVAYIVAHEYAHNVQNELGYFDAAQQVAVRPFELQADCFAGAWGNSVYRSGGLQPGDVEEALSTAKAVGDFDELDPQHHGTPDERREAWLRGYESGDPSACQAFL